MTLRLRGSKTELEEMGEDVTDMATTTSALQAKLLALTGGKVDIMLDANTFKNSTQILREMAEAWEDMNDIQRASALELMGGKRQANVLSALIQNFDTVEEAIETSANSAGSALQENERYLDSIQGKIDQFNNAMQAMWSDTLDSDVVKGFVELATQLIKIVDAIGPLNVALVGFFTYLEKKHGVLSNFFKPAEDGVEALKNQLAKAEQDLAKATQVDTQRGNKKTAQNRRDAEERVAILKAKIQESSSEAVLDGIDESFDPNKIKKSVGGKKGAITKRAKKLENEGMSFAQIQEDPKIKQWTQEIKEGEQALNDYNAKVSQADAALKQKNATTIQAASAENAKVGAETRDAAATNASANADVLATMASDGKVAATWKDVWATAASKDATFAEVGAKLKQLLIMKLLSMEYVKNKIATGELTAAKLTELTMTELLTLGMKGLIAKLWAGAKAAGAFIISLGPVVWIVTGIVAAIGIAIATFSHFHKTTKELKEELDGLKSELSDVRSELSSINSELETTNDRMAELLAKDKLTFEEQEELDKLRKTNDELERRKELLEDQEENNAGRVGRQAAKVVDKTKNKKDWWETEWFLGGGITSTYLSNLFKNEGEEAQKNISDYVKLKEKFDNASSLKEQEKYQKKLDKEADKIDAYIAELSETLDGVEYGDSEESDAALDYLAELESKYAIARGSEKAKSNAVKGVLAKKEFAETKAAIDEYVDALAKGDKSAADSIEQIINHNADLVEDLKARGVEAQDAIDYYTMLGSEANYATIDGKIKEVSRAAETFESLVDGGMFKVDGINIGLAELFDEEGKIIQTKLSQVFNDTSDQTRKDITTLLEGSYDQIKNGTVDVKKLLTGFGLKTAQQVIEIQNKLLGEQNLELFPNLKEEIDGIIDTFSEFSKAVGGVVDALDTLEQARAEEAYSGSVSIETLENLMKYTDDYAQLVEIDETGAIRLAADAEEILIKQRLEKIKTDAAAAVQTAQTNLEQAKYNAKAVNETGPIQEAMTAATDGLAGAWAYLGSIIGDVTDGNFSGMFGRASDAYNMVTAGREGKRAQVNVSVEDAEKALNKALDQQRIANALTSNNVKAKYSSDEASGGNATKEDAEDDAFQKEMDYWENRIKANQAKYEQVQNEIDLLEAKGKRAGAAYYKEQIKLEKDRLNLLNQQQDQVELRLKALEAAGKKGSEEWWEAAHTFNDIENEIDGVTLSIQELNNAIIEGSHGFVDDIQSAYDTLTESHQEYVENGYLSVDTLQSLLELEPKYLDLLVDENGNLSLNEKVLQDIAKARIEDLAIKQQSAILENALALATDGSKQAIIEQIAVMETANAVGEDWISVQMRGITAAINARVATGELTATEGEEFIYRTLSQIEAVKTVTESSLADISKSLSGPDEDDTFQKQIDYWENRIQANQSKYEQVQNEIDLLEAKGKRAGSSYYQEQIALENQRKGLLEKQRDASIEYLGTLEAGSEEWWETAHAINDIESELDGVDLSIQELKNKIIDEAHGFVDDIQNVYDTLTEAQKEYAENGYLSVDTMQQLLELEPKYLDLLVDENGNLSLNQQALQDVARARIEDLVIKQQSAILDNALALATNGSTQAIIDQIAVMEYATKVGDNFVATQMAQIKAMLAQRVAAGELSQEYADAFISGVESQIAAVQAVAQSSLSDLDQSLSSSSSSDDEEDAFQREMDYWENRIRANRAKYEQIQNDIDLLESKGKKADAAYYEEQIKLEEDRKGLLEQQKAAALAHIATLQEGSDEWWEAAHILNDIEGELDDVTAAIVSLQDAIGEIDAYKFEEFNKRLDNLTNKLSTIRDLIAPNGSEDWFDDQGNWTEDGVAVLGTYIQELEIYKNGLAEVNAERKKYEDAYAGNEEYYEKLGIHSEQEYYDKVQEIIEQQYDYTKLISDTEQSVVDMYESQIDAVEEYTQTLVESYNDYIDSVKEALDAERDLYDFKKNVKKQSKDIAAIERRIASLSGSTNASDIAERRKLEADLYDARESLNDTYYDHAQSAQDEALEKEAAAYEETMTRFVDGLHTSLDQATTDMEAFLAGVTTTVMYNADTVLAKYKETNLPLTTEITNPWIKAKEAVGAYDKDALDLMNEWTKEDGYFAQFNATGTENLESPWGAGTNAASKFKTDVAGIMSQVVSDIETNVTTAGTKLSELYVEIQDTETRMSAVVESVSGAVSNISSQVGAASQEIEDFYSQIQDYEDRYGDGGNSGGDTGSSLTYPVGAPTSNPSGSGSPIQDADHPYYEDPDADKLIYDPYQNPYQITETAAEKRENARIAAQAYVDKAGFSEGDKARWGQDPNFLPLLQALIKAGGSINDLKGKVYTYKTSGTLPSGQYSVSGLNAISWGADDFTVKMGGKSYDVATGDPATVGQESDLIKLCGTNPATGTLAMVNKSLFVRHKNGRWRIVGTKNDGRALTSEFYSKLNAYAKGTTGTPDDQFAIVDEFGPELIMHANPATGRLEYLTKGSGVIPADMTKNLMEWSQFTPDAMNLGSGVNVNMINNAVNKPEFNLNVDNFLRCDNVSQDSLPELKQFVKTEMNNLIKQMNYSLKGKGAR